MIEKKCIVCGKEFTTIYPRKITCGNKCYVEHHNERNRINYKNRKIVKSRNKSVSNSKKLSNDALEARKLGMSYGQYVALKHMEEQSEREKEIIRNKTE